MSNQNDGNNGKGPGLGEAPALSHDAPMRSAGYVLDWRDALAWEALPREMRGWRKAVMLLWLAGAGAVLALLPERVAGAEGSLQYYAVLVALLAVQYGIATVVLTGARYLRAWRRFPHPVQVRLDFWGDHLEESRSDLVAPQVIVPEYCGVFITTPSHMFVPYLRDQVLIVPVSAFDNAEAMRAEAASYEELWAGMRDEM
ncbi:MAG: hypothetical protein A3D16_04935 [Rhodobacterales bacterium RIFCSPHIGHO2_02_FULL_62_130]|nr:MAG: hypothetical protein A3D16_04935 [Rhodobacterales bacterium RIFCSPHIGHO2_02_FULL_62_130]OHC58326.1 MAG: hypothetical protein A3E48_11755 [Rhodobacterales bacterium RIFCSPHIGHO2_12_FULL_62_75]